jgi:hypothetical protein
MREVGTPNAIVVGHNVMRGGHLMGGVEAQADADGLWNYSSTNPDNPMSKRRFSVVTRVGGLPTPLRTVVLSEDGRMRFAKQRPTAVPGEPGVPVRDSVLAYVAACNAKGFGPSQRGLRANVAGSSTAVDRAAADLVAEHLLVTRPRAGRGGGVAYWLPV